MLSQLGIHSEGFQTLIHSNLHALHDKSGCGVASNPCTSVSKKQFETHLNVLESTFFSVKFSWTTHIYVSIGVSNYPGKQ